MRKALLVGLGLLLCVSMASTQTKFPPSGGGTGSFVSPGAGIIVDTDGAGTLDNRTLTAGTGVSVTNGAGAAGNPTVAVDTATTPQYTTGTAAPSATCNKGEVYAETDQLRACICSDTNTWTCNGKLRAHATDCTALADGLADEMCFERDANTLYVCEPSAGGCDTAGEWTAVGAVSGLTAGRVAIAASASSLTDDSDLTFLTDTLTATKLKVGVGTLSATGIANTSSASTGFWFPDGAVSIGIASGGQERHRYYGQFKTLTESSATDVVRISFLATSPAGGFFEWFVRANDATDFQTRVGRTPFAITSKGTTETCTVTDDAAQSVVAATSASTLTCTVTCASAVNDSVDLELNCVSSLEQTELSAKWNLILFADNSTVVVTAQ